jgi:hypothetical protein
MTDRANAKPILFVDVDGVISLFGFDPDQAPAGRFHWVNGILHFIGSDAGVRLLRLRDQFELVWATGWEETANEFLPHLLGLPEELPFLTFNGRARFGTAHWKIGAINDYAGLERPMAWIDDCFDDGCLAWADDRPGPTLLVRTGSETGLLDEHVDRLVAWAREVSAHPQARANH